MDRRPLDPRRHAYRDDLADARLQGLIVAARFVRAQPGHVLEPVAPVFAVPSPSAALSTQMLFGEGVDIFDEDDGWAWVQSHIDGYVGYTPASMVGPVSGTPTHRISALSAPTLMRPEVKAPPRLNLPFGARVRVVREDAGFAALEGGDFVPLQHLSLLQVPIADYVSVAEGFLGTPYLWGGRTRAGIDCSGLVQIALQAAGVEAPRDSDMQQAEIGIEVAADADLQRGDLVFWRGHVGVMTDARHLLHANAHDMAVVREELAQAVARIQATSGGPMAVRRPAFGGRSS